MNLLEQTDGDLPQIDESKNYLEELVGEDKKFKTTEDLAKGKALSDNFIKILESRLDAAREEFKKVRDENIAGPKLQELIDKNEAILQQLTSRKEPNSNEDLNKGAYDPKQFEDVMDSKIQQAKQRDREDSNFKLVQDKLTERFGKTYPNFLQEQAKELGLTDIEVNQMARKNPSLFIKTFDLNAPKNDDNFQTPPKSSLRSDNFAPRTPKARTMSYYNDLRKKDPNAWFDPKIAVQMDKDSQALGNAFFD